MSTTTAAAVAPPLPTTLQRFLEVFTAVLVASTAKAAASPDTAAAVVTAKGAKLSSSKRGGAPAQAATAAAAAADRAEEERQAALTPAQLAALQVALPQWLQLLHTSAVLGPTDSETDSTVAISVSNGDGSAEGLVQDGAAAELMAAPRAVDESLFSFPQLALIPQRGGLGLGGGARGSAAALVRRGPHALLPPQGLSLNVAEGGDGGDARVDSALSRVAALSWLHRCWVELLLLRLRRRSGDHGDGDDQRPLLTAEAVGELAGGLTDALAAAATAAGVTTGHTAFITQPSFVTALTQVCGGSGTVLDTTNSKDKGDGPTAVPWGSLPLVADLFFLECCRVAAGGDDGSFDCERLPLDVLRRVCEFLAARMRTELQQEEVESAVTPLDSMSCRRGVGVLVAVALQHPMAGTAVKKSTRAQRRALRPKQKPQPQPQSRRLASAESKPPEPARRKTDMAAFMAALAVVADIGDDDNDNEYGDNDDLDDSTHSDEKDELTVDDEDDDDAGLVDDLTVPDEEEEELGEDTGSDSNDDDGGGGGSSAAGDGTFLQCEVPLASLLLSLYRPPPWKRPRAKDSYTHTVHVIDADGDAEGSDDPGPVRGSLQLSGEAYGRVGHLGWFPSGGSTAHQRHLMRQAKGQ